VAGRLENKFSQRLGAVEEKVEEHTVQLTEHEARIQALERDFAEWRAAQESMDSTGKRTGGSSRATEFEAEPPAGAIKVTSQSPFSRAVLDPALAATLTDAGLSMKDCSIRGKGTKKRFDILFSSADGAKQFLESMQDNDGNWKPFFVLDHKNVKIQIYYSPALSPKQEKLEMLTKALAKIIKGKIPPTHEVFAAKRQGLVKVDWVPVGCLALPNATDVNFKWNLPELQKHSLDKEALVREFADGGKGNVQWSS